MPAWYRVFLRTAMAASYDQGHVVGLLPAADLVHLIEDGVEDLGS